jgi:hypothetical protein
MIPAGDIDHPMPLDDLGVASQPVQVRRVTPDLAPENRGTATRLAEYGGILYTQSGNFLKLACGRDHIFTEGV